MQTSTANTTETELADQTAALEKRIGLIGPTPEITPMAVEVAIKAKKIDLVAFAEACGNTAYLEGLEHTASSNKIFDMSAYNPMTARRLTEFFYDCISKAERKFESFKSCYILGFHRVMRHEEIDASMDYPQFLETLEEITPHADKVLIERIFAQSFLTFCRRKDYSDDLYAADVWDVSMFNLRRERINPADKIRTVSFSRIRNEHTKRLIKSWVAYRFERTDLSVKTIRGDLDNAIRVVNLVTRSIADWTEADVIAVRDYLLRKHSKRTAREYYQDAQSAFRALSARGSIIHNPFDFVHGIDEVPYQYIETAPSKHVINQIFSNLDLKTWGSDIIIWFLIIYSTGMRKSEVTLLERNCLASWKRAGKTRYYIRYYQNKMRKFVENEIPGALFDLIVDYRNTLPLNHKYLFESPIHAGQPRDTDGITKRLDKMVNSMEITEEDGTPYHFKAHAYRHLMAHRMLEAHIPYQFIQAQLHHLSPEMSLAYIEYSNSRKMALMHGFCDAHAKESTFQVPVKTGEDVSAHVSKALCVQVLTAGVCARPAKLGKCSHGNKCLRCSSFRTSKEFLPVLKRQVSRNKLYLKCLSEKGLEQQMKSVQEDLKILTDIISKLEEEQPDA